jgi:DNA-binding response OmpR family regulator
MPHLLLVDDEESLRSVVAERLIDEGFEVTQAADGDAAIKALDGFAFDVIVSDLRLPPKDGLPSEASAQEGRQVIDAALTRSAPRERPRRLRVAPPAEPAVEAAARERVRHPQRPVEVVSAERATKRREPGRRADEGGDRGGEQDVPRRIAAGELR